ncbi:CSN8-PSD8-EIF3K domain-containing protein [Mycena indigotica]|uniref:CSN8-PSD8-EIF3K domain-containing protein n=1 Tax=Mycena indigotica TaxID=2126181 RepID=A0A8H6S9W4_9AGAR|nr:CSN8-PSD8-EIF3K domain-containing protein [Mycena indigotica]KAF7295528.1 CSN8-PSD8-EIF3K domain-containing protein [Mycena indigotica]
MPSTFTEPGFPRAHRLRASDFVCSTRLWDASDSLAVVDNLDAAGYCIWGTDSRAPAAAPAPQSVVSDHFTQIFPLATEKKYKELIRLAELNDYGADSDRSPTRLALTTPLVLAYLILDDLQVVPLASPYSAFRATLLCLPSQKPSSRCWHQLWILERKYANVYSRTTELLAITSGSDFLDANLGAILGLMLNAFLESFRTRTFNLLKKAYTSLPVSLAQVYLGLGAEEVLSAAASDGWSYDASTQILTPAQRSASTQLANGFTPFSTLATFDFVANSVAKLET